MALRRVGSIPIERVSALKSRMRRARLRLVGDTDAEEVAAIAEDAYELGREEGFLEGVEATRSTGYPEPYSGALSPYEAPQSFQDGYVAGFADALREDQTGLVVEHRVGLNPKLQADLSAIRQILQQRRPVVPFGMGVAAGLGIALLLYIAMKQTER